MMRQRELKRLRAALCTLWFLGAGWSSLLAAFECAPLIEAAASHATTSYSESLLWEVRRPRQPASFLFGTIHLAGDAVGQPNAAIKQALRASMQFGMEVVLDSAALAEVAQRMRFNDGQRLSRVVGADLFERAAKLLTAAGVSRELAEQLKPWAAYTTLSLPTGLAGTPLDLVLLEMAQARRTRIFGLETLAEQTAAFEQVALVDQIALLAEVVCHHARLQRTTAALIAAYARGNLAALYRLAQETESPAQEKLMDGLLRARNQRMVRRLKAPLTEGRAFVALGALHLPGPQGVLALLVAAGWQVRPLASR